MSKRVILIRWGAYGDHIHMSNVIKAFHDDGYQVDMEYNYKGNQIHAFNPRITNKIPFEPNSKESEEKVAKNPRYHLDRLDRYRDHYDHYVNFANSIEGSLIAGEDSSEYYLSLRLRRAKNANICYYDQSMKWAGLHEDKYMGQTGEIYFPQTEHEHVQKMLRPHRDAGKYIILWALRGSMWQKAVYPLAKGIITEFIKRHPNTVVYTTGDKFCQKWEWDAGENVIHMSGRMPFRKAVLMSRYVDLVVTPETGLGIAAGVYGTPKIMLLTAASIKNIVGNDENDYSLQSDAYCSPCTRAIYNTRHCPQSDLTHDYPDDPQMKAYAPGENGCHLPICVKFDSAKVLERMEEAYTSGWKDVWRPAIVHTIKTSEGMMEVYV